MLSCPQPIEDPFFCPTKPEIFEQLLGLLPPGRAFNTHEAAGDRIEGDYNSQVGTFQTDTTPLGSEPFVDTNTNMEAYWLAYAEVLEYWLQRACRLIPEFFCEEAVETIPEWHIDYGFPDDCDPWTTLCDKVRAQGGSTCAYLAEIAAARGWVLTCSDCIPLRTAIAGCATAGCSKSCGCPAGVIWVTINLPASTAYETPATDRTAGAGRARAGAAYTGPPCPPNAEPLQCLIERWKPAHIRAEYIYITDESGTSPSSQMSQIPS